MSPSCTLDPSRQDLVEKRASASSDALTCADSWAGAVWKQAAGTFNSVTGAVTVPHISGPTKSSVSVALGIDGFSCPNSAALQAGFDGIITQDGPMYEGKEMLKHASTSVSPLFCCCK
ncbi:hypothetical protein JVT61DRAFT_793 [Boletus reticuloceps]|uniref:Uncharacterized protein n=1 Tax=Boletus reticuloceps TaxID=495285 RepID=A0A8I2YZ05_9AGAM|nr:hypothetical protein JVT61DRAFT_793 [Boletus reticuloceps]